MLANQAVASVILTPTVGGTLVNAAVLAQQADYTAGRNTTARVRLAAAVSGNALVSASAAGTAGRDQRRRADGDRLRDRPVGIAAR